ncbi:MAG: ADP-ribosylglycohydrolase family protein [Bdellovibrionaceae bacterium]|nr:ADP-ribosylglycohydrolase family protein [Pseudobdellovibrionaceae bacterium]
MLGAVIGDIVGSVYEFDNIKTKDFPFFQDRCRFTDDTICTLALAECLLDGGDPAIYLRRWCREYESSYGFGFRRWVHDDNAGPYNSWGNGAAMRVSPAAYLAKNHQDALRLAEHITQVTHDHPRGLLGAAAVTTAIWLALSGATAAEIRKQIERQYRYDLGRRVDEIRPSYEFNESCDGTVPEAITCALEAQDFEDAIRNAISIGGDSDTVAAITGSIAEALFGIPSDLRTAAMPFLRDRFIEVLNRSYKSVGSFQSKRDSKSTR